MRQNCPSCGRENPADNAFCGGCGSGLERACGSCGHANPADHAFCGRCGQSLDAAPAPEPPSQEPRSYTPSHLAERILTSRSALEGERKHVTVLFVDTVASTAMGRSADPELMHGIMDRFFRLVADEVHRYEGTINQFLGDGLMALFGAPVALEDAPRRAVSASLGIQRLVRELAKELKAAHDLVFRVRIGINSGPVVVGRIGDDLRMDYTAVGDTTNLADRLQRLAEPGSIVISESTERLVRGFFDLRDLGPQQVRGHEEPVGAFEVLAERSVSGRFDMIAASGLTPLIGRQRELDGLMAAFESAREGRGQVAFVIGDPGIGKSRLIHEFRKRLGDELHSWARGRCTELTQHTPFHPLVDALKEQMAIEDHDSDEVAQEKLERFTRELGGDLGWTLPYVRHLLSLPVLDEAVETMDASVRRSELCRALDARFMALANQRPLVLVIEDLHWIDPASEEFLGFLADAVPASHALLVFTHRPGYRQPFGDRTYHVRVAVQALTQDDTAAMVESVLEASSLPEELRSLIGRKAEGNPLFVEEITKSLLEQGVLQVRDGRVELATDISNVAVPDSIQDVLMARIDRLADEPKRAIQLASVIGREFALRLLEKISEAGASMSEMVGELRALELIYEKATHPELAFMFKHALTHDVAYESVLVERRKALHRIVGIAIEELYRDRLAEHFEVLALHFSMGEDWERAFLYHESASEKASEAFANQSVAEHCRQALNIAERMDPAPSIDRRRVLEERVGAAYFCMSDFQASGDAYARAAELSGETETGARNLARSSYGYVWAHLYVPAGEMVRRARELAHALRSDPAEALALASEYELEMVMGRTERDSLVKTAVELAERSGDGEALATALTHYTQWCEWRGDYPEALRVAERALEIAMREHMPAMASFAQWYKGLSLAAQGHYGAGIGELRSALELAERVGDRALRARFLNTLGWCHAEFGAHQRASEYNRRSTELARELVELKLVTSAPELYANGSINLAGNRIALGDLDGAHEAIEPIVESLREDDDPWMRWRYSLHVKDVLARLALVEGDPEQALALTTEELEGARRHVARKLEARALELRARALVQLDRREEAGDAAREALGVAQQLGYAPILWRAPSVLSELARRDGDRASADEFVNQARSRIEQLAGELTEPELRRDFAAIGEQLVHDPLGAYR
jgi:class 3 adenylate cyclase/tetratricopeptide (TPR) repeat protein